jgi:glycosyltransferase involved in cell wall biosynthesis
MLLVNLLSWLPGHSGFGSYVQRVVPGLEGLRLQLGNDGQGVLLTPEQWLPEPPAWAPGRRMRFLQRYSLVQHGLDLPALLRGNGIKLDQLEAIYSPFFDALLCWPEVPQLITCHDLTPLVASNSRKAWLRYRLWQPRHCRAATRLIAISRYVADQLVAFGVKSDQIEVIPNGIRIQRPPVLAPSSQDLVALARHDVNKNLPALFRGIDQLQRQWPQWSGTLRIIGRGGRQTPLVERLHQSLPRPQQVKLIDALPQAELVALVRASMALLSASTEEGFDYPVLEAKAEGIPTLISDIPVHREFHEGSSLFFPSVDEGMCFADQVQRLHMDGNLWQQLSRQGVALAQSLSVERQRNAIREQLADLVR